MPPVLLRCAFTLVTCLTVMLMALRAPAVDNSDVHALLTPQCSTACFMGVRVGETDGKQATSQVEQHEWSVGETVFIQPINDINTHYITWQWSGLQPASIDARATGEMRVYREQVAAMTVRTTLPLGAVWLALGGTRSGVIIPAVSRPERDVTVIAVFPDVSLLARITLPKAASTAGFWSSQVELESTTLEAITYFSQYELPHWCRLHCSP